MKKGKNNKVSIVSRNKKSVNQSINQSKLVTKEKEMETRKKRFQQIKSSRRIPLTVEINIKKTQSKKTIKEGKQERKKKQPRE